MKRLFDLLVSGIGLVVLSPLLLAIGLVVCLTSPGPALHRAKRVGRDSELFTLYKFRSMVADADKQGPGVTTAGDSRVTPIGRILRRTKLDELPQLFNVLRGDMSLVGPRPEDPRYVALYTTEQRGVLRVRPGITSPASVYYRDEERILQGTDWETQYTTQVLPAKLALDLEYARRANLLTDLKIIWQTARALFR
jgi:lipopolysaccharide/colanic/teichoic acid biosynthesis glycosyltransferase